MDGRNRTLAPATLNLHDRSFSPSELYDNLNLLLGRPVELTQLRNPLNPTRPILYYTLPPENDVAHILYTNIHRNDDILENESDSKDEYSSDEEASQRDGTRNTPSFSFNTTQRLHPDGEGP